MPRTTPETEPTTLPSEATLRALVNDLMDVDEFKVDPTVTKIQATLREDEDRMFTAAELGHLAYFTSSLREMASLFVRRADEIESQFFHRLGGDDA
jgi:hypothetical protein